MKDLTDRELMDELQKRFDQNKKSLLEVQKLNEELKVVNKKLEDSEALKSHFISNITNEIINPFSSIMGLAKNIMSLKEPDWKQVKSMVSMIYYEAFNLDFQLRNIFVAAKLEAGEIYPEVLNVDVQKLLESVIDSFRYELDKKQMKLKYTFDIEPRQGDVYYFKTDPEKVKLIVSNLLSNAVKYSNEGKDIILSVNYSLPLRILVQVFLMKISKLSLTVLKSWIQESIRFTGVMGWAYRSIKL
jgi:signal transduction histidine kinase